MGRRSSRLTRLSIGGLLLTGFIGCVGSYQHGLVAGLGAQRGYPLGSVQTCIDAPEAIRTADLGAVLYAREIVRRGLAAYDQVASVVSQLVVCIIPKPEPCCAGSAASCVRDTDGQVRDKAGCNIGLWAWVSQTWGGETRDVAPDLLHELGHALAGALGIATNAAHSTLWHTEIEPAVLKQFNATRTTP